jgi:enoyl-[acyl-carrier protein] reductase II
MLRTAVCENLGIEVPIMQAAIWPATSPELVAAVCEAGGLGSIGSVFESAESVEGQMARVRELTDRPFAINHVVPLLDEEAFEATLEAKPAVVSLALGDPGDLVDRAHATGAKVIHQVHTVEQARRVAGLGVDAIIAQGSEAGGQGHGARRGRHGTHPPGRRRGGPHTRLGRGRCGRRPGARSGTGAGRPRGERRY